MIQVGFEGRPVAVGSCVRTLEPPNEVGVLKVETEKSNGHETNPVFVSRFVWKRSRSW